MATASQSKHRIWPVIIGTLLVVGVTSQCSSEDESSSDETSQTAQQPVSMLPAPEFGDLDVSPSVLTVGESARASVSVGRPGPNEQYDGAYALYFRASGDRWRKVKEIELFWGLAAESIEPRKSGQWKLAYKGTSTSSSAESEPVFVVVKEQPKIEAEPNSWGNYGGDADSSKGSVHSWDGDDGGGEAYYGNCSEARAADAAPLTVGEPGYRSGLDRDRDGVACEG